MSLDLNSLIDRARAATTHVYGGPQFLATEGSTGRETHERYARRQVADDAWKEAYAAAGPEEFLRRHTAAMNAQKQASTARPNSLVVWEVANACLEQVPWPSYFNRASAAVMFATEAQRCLGHERKALSFGIGYYL